jgi:hypothetical protein
MTKLPKVRECIDYITGCGFKYLGGKYPLYFFEKINGVMPNGSKEVTFTIKELRDTFKYGW